jgi:hypothetical protein
MVEGREVELGMKEQMRLHKKHLQMNSGFLDEYTCEQNIANEIEKRGCRPMLCLTFSVKTSFGRSVFETLKKHDRFHH